VALGIGAVVVLQLLFTCFGPLQLLFGNEAVPLHVRPVLLAGGLVFFVAIEVEKLIIRSSSLGAFVTGVEAGAKAPGRAIQARKMKPCAVSSFFFAKKISARRRSRRRGR
jgi:hypothetical protein